jgi:hypothetical protein
MRAKKKRCLLFLLVHENEPNYTIFLSVEIELTDLASINKTH